MPIHRIKSTEFAKFLISRALDKGISDIGETKLHKLLYICDGFLLALDNDIIGERACAWNYGPVYPKVRKWLARHPDALTSIQNCSADAAKLLADINAVALVDFVLSTYGKWSAAALSLWTHKPNAPWELALSKGGGVMSSPISKEDMKLYFKGFLKQ